MAIFEEDGSSLRDDVFNALDGLEINCILEVYETLLLV